MKKEGTAGKVGPCAKFLEEDKFSFQRAISKFVLEHDILLYLVLMFRRVNINLVWKIQPQFSSKVSMINDK